MTFRGFSTVDARIPVGADGAVLTADSTVALGVSYKTPAGAPAVNLIASQNLAQGDFVNVLDVAGTPKARKASATNGFEAQGYVNAAYLTGVTAVVQLGGVNAFVTGLTAGRVFLSLTDGLVTNTAPSAAGQMVQEVGEAVTSSSVSFQPYPGVLLATTAATGTVGTTHGQEFAASGTFNVPANVSLVWARGIGGGGGGASTIAAATGGGGGGCGEFFDNLAIPCTPGGTITINIGAAGTAAAAGQVTAQPGGNGGDTSIVANGLTYFARGGFGANNAGASGAGGGYNGSISKATNASGTPGTQESPIYFGGSSGGGGGNTIASPGASGSPNAGFPTGTAGGAIAGSQAGGGSGGASPWGLGGQGGAGGAIGAAPAAGCYGAGGGGGGGKATTTIGGGAGLAGYVLIEWIA